MISELSHIRFTGVARSLTLSCV